MIALHSLSVPVCRLRARGLRPAPLPSRGRAALIPDASGPSGLRAPLADGGGGVGEVLLAFPCCHGVLVSHVPKAAIVEAGPQFAPDYGGRLSELKKDELAAKAEKLATGTGWLPPMFARQAAWIDPPAVSVDAEAEAGTEAETAPEASPMARAA